MRITYIHHSGFLAETGQALLLFDYAGGTLPELSRDKALIVFASHRHGDHFDPAIFALADRHPDVTYVLSDDIWENQVPEARFGQTRFVDPGKVLRLNKGGGICITAFRSTDEGVAFMIETEGRTIYHAGDLNDWHWKGRPRSGTRRCTRIICGSWNASTARALCRTRPWCLWTAGWRTSSAWGWMSS